jgi:hypothetical protein
MPIDPALKQVYASAPSGRHYVETLELYHSQFPQTFYLNNTPKLWRFNLGDGNHEVFNPVPFHVVFPTQDGQGQQDMQLILDNVGRDAVEAIEAAAVAPRESIRVTCRVYLNEYDSMPLNSPPLVLMLSEIEVNRMTIAGAATRVDVLNKLFPSMLYRIDNFPGLDR